MIVMISLLHLSFPRLLSRLDHDRRGEREMFCLVERDVDADRPVARFGQLDAIDLPGAVAALPGEVRAADWRSRGSQRQTHLPGVQRLEILVPKPDCCPRRPGAPGP